MRFRNTLPGSGKEKHMQLFEKLAEYRYEQLVFCHDKATGLRAVVAIHDTTLGPALGGCRMYPYATEEDALADVLRLARGMTYKAAASGLNLGGGKSVIIGDPRKDKSEALFRSFGRYIETLGGRYIVAEDVGTSTEDANFMRVETSYVVGVDVTRGGLGRSLAVHGFGRPAGDAGLRRGGLRHHILRRPHGRGAGPRPRRLQPVQAAPRGGRELDRDRPRREGRRAGRRGVRREGRSIPTRS
jgi:hypothetical protein